MKIKFNRFALIPHCCAECEELFWLEPYRHCVGVYIYLGQTKSVNFCKECVLNGKAKEWINDDTQD